jgi:Tfp pilus assembly protein PilV
MSRHPVRRRPRSTCGERVTRPVPHAPAGFTIVEVLVAIMLLATGLLAIAGLAAAAHKATYNGGTQTVAAAIVQSRLDLINSLPCAAIANQSGTATSRGITERWQTVQIPNSNMLTVRDTLIVRGRTRVFAYETVRACR